MMDCRILFSRSGLVAAAVLALFLVDSRYAQEPPFPEPTDETEVRDLSEPPLRTVTANISCYSPGWNVKQQIDDREEPEEVESMDDLARWVRSHATMYKVTPQCIAFRSPHDAAALGVSK